MNLRGKPPNLQDTDPLEPVPLVRDDSGGGREIALKVLWAPSEPRRVGHAGFLGSPDGDIGEEWILGRGDKMEPNRVRFVQQRPGELTPTEPLRSPAVSAEAVLITRTEDGFRVKRTGRHRIFVNGVACEEAILSVGGTLLLEQQLLFLCVERSRHMPRALFVPPLIAGPFGEVNKLGMAGESPLLWELLSRIARVALTRGPNHVLITGESGTGKELVAKAIHLLSDRAGKPFISKSLTALAASVIEVLLFGNRKNFPNPGTPETPGVIGEADGGVLFLDEIGEVPHEIHARLLRALDKEGEYQRVGDLGNRSSNFRMICATNRPIESLKFDLVARLPLRIEVPSLEARREDIPFLLRHLLLELARTNEDIVGRYVEVVDGREEPRMDGFFVDYLVRKRHPLNVRGLRRSLWEAIERNEHPDRLCATEQMIKELARERASLRPAAPAEEVTVTAITPPDGTHRGGAGRGDGRALTRDEVMAALEKNAWRREETSRDLGLKDRYVLRRLIAKFKLERPKR